MSKSPGPLYNSKRSIRLDLVVYQESTGVPGKRCQASGGKVRKVGEREREDLFCPSLTLCLARPLSSIPLRPFRTSCAHSPSHGGCRLAVEWKTNWIDGLEKQALANYRGWRWWWRECVCVCVCLAGRGGSSEGDISLSPTPMWQRDLYSWKEGEDSQWQRQTDKLRNSHPSPLALKALPSASAKGHRGTGVCPGALPSSVL